MNHRPRLVPAEPAPAPSPVPSVCPVCARSDSIRTIRTDTGRRVTCRFVAETRCNWEGMDRPFRRPVADSMPAPFTERLGRIAERVVDECAERGLATARIDTQYVDALRSAVRRVARDREVQVRTVHIGDGRVEVRVG